MSGQVSQVLEGMDKLNVKVESFMQQLLACREDGANVRNPKTIAATINIEGRCYYKDWIPQNSWCCKKPT